MSQNNNNNNNNKKNILRGQMPMATNMRATWLCQWWEENENPTKLGYYFVHNNLVHHPFISF